METSPRVRAVCLGDSITHNRTNGVNAIEFWPGQCQEILRDVLNVTNTLWRNLGSSGNTSTQLLNRVHGAFQWKEGGNDASPVWNVPDLACVMIGVNDPPGITSATTQANLEAIVRCLLNRVAGVAATESALPARDAGDNTIPLGTRFWVVADGSTTGGVADAGIPAYLNQPARVAGSIASVRPAGSTTSGAVWIKRRHASGTTGWARIADDYTRGVKHVLVMSTQYTPSDTPGSPVAQDAGVRTAQQAAVAVLQGISGIGSAACSYLNHWQKTADDVTAGYLTDPINALTYTAGNQHYNAEGHRLIAVRVIEAINALTFPGTSQTFPQYWAAQA